jgi:hypothetical protein
MAKTLQYTADGLPYYQDDNNPLPVDQSYDPATGVSYPTSTSPYTSGLPVEKNSLVDILTGAGGGERYQLFPEKIVRSALSLPTDVMQGKVQTPIVPPSVPISSDVGGEDELLQRVQDMAAMMGGGGVGMAEKGAVGSAGGKLVQPEIKAPLLNKFGEGYEFNVEPSSISKNGYEATVIPKDRSGFQKYKPRNNKDDIHYYDPKIAELKTFDKGEPYEFQVPQLKTNSGLSNSIEPLSDPNTIYRGMSAGEYNNFLQTGKIQSNGEYNLEGQNGLTYWSSDPKSAVSYSNSFAPAKFKARPDAPAYVVATRKPNEVVNVNGVDSHEVGVSRPIDKSEIIGIWEGKPYSIEPFKISLRPSNNGYAEGSSVTGSPQLGWRNILKSDNEAAAPIAALEKAPTFYSAVENAVNNASMKAAPAKQWLSTISNSKGVKPEELDWTGLKDYLGEKDGPISKQEVQDYLQANKVQLKEVQKAPEQLNIKPSDEYEGEFDVVDNRGNVRFTGANREDAEGYVNEEKELGGRNPTKYSKYQLPGAEPNSYREMLLTLPNKVELAKTQLKNAIGNGIEWGKGKLYSDEIIRGLANEDLSVSDLPSNLHSVAANFVDTYKNSNNYKSSHWDEPNILAHVRVNERNVVGENGQNDAKRSYHVEEAQSDWHQQGREKGYKLSKEQEAKLEPEFNRIDDKIVNSGDEEVMGHPDINKAVKMAVDRKIITPEEAKTYLRYSDSQRLGAVPDAPFKRTDQWTDLVVKRIIRDAAEKGLDRISWTPGEAQAARYDLSKQIDELHYNPDTWKLIARNNGRDMINENNVRPEQLADYIGKEASEKLMSRGSNSNGLRSLRGQQLKIGGEGMRYYYDKIFAKAMEKWTGEKVKEGKTTIPDKFDKEAPFIVRNASGEVVYNNIFDENYARRLASEIEGGTYHNASKKPIGTKQSVSYIDLPQSVKDTALRKGFPLFSSGFMLNPVEGNPLINNKQDVPYGAGASNTESGYPVNIDKRIPQFDNRLKLPNGQPANLHKYLMVHEIEEHKAMQQGMPYEKAHLNVGTPAERKAVEADGVNWGEYEKIMDGYLAQTEHENPKDPPKNLFKDPYPHKKQVLLEKNAAAKYKLVPVQGNPFSVKK